MLSSDGPSSDVNPLLKVDDTLVARTEKVDEGSMVRQGSSYNPEIKIRYTRDELLKIFKSLGRFEHPLSQAEKFSLFNLESDRLETFDDLMTVRPDVVLEMLKEDIENRRRRSMGSRSPYHARDEVL